MKKSRKRYHYQFKKCQKAEERIRKSKLLDACINGGTNLFSEIKSIRASKHVVATSMDGKNDDVRGVFKDKYEKLYNSTDDGAELSKVQAEIGARVNVTSLDDVLKVTPNIVKEDQLYEKLSLILQGFLVHGHVTLVLLLATLVPIKDKLGSINSSKNYRIIAISSLLLKLIDWVFLILFGSKFNLNDFQFAYQTGCSTTMCTWAVLETVEYFMKNFSDSSIDWLMSYLGGRTQMVQVESRTSS